MSQESLKSSDIQPRKREAVGASDGGLLLRQTRSTVSGELVEVQVVPAEEEGRSSVGPEILSRLVPWFRRWREPVRAECRLALPVAPDALIDSGFLQHAVRLTDDFELPREAVVFDVQQSEITSTPGIVTALQHISDEGFGVSVSCFVSDGPGFPVLSGSAVGYLRCAEGVFRGALTSEFNWQYLHGLTSLANHLGKTVILCGIETKHERDLLASLGNVLFQDNQLGGPIFP